MDIVNEKKGSRREWKVELCAPKRKHIGLDIYVKTRPTSTRVRPAAPWNQRWMRFSFSSFSWISFTTAFVVAYKWPHRTPETTSLMYRHGMTRRAPVWLGRQGMNETMQPAAKGLKAGNKGLRFTELPLLPIAPLIGCIAASLQSSLRSLPEYPSVSSTRVARDDLVIDPAAAVVQAPNIRTAQHSTGMTKTEKYRDQDVTFVARSQAEGKN